MNIGRHENDMLDKASRDSPSPHGREGKQHHSPMQLRNLNPPIRPRQMITIIPSRGAKLRTRDDDLG